MLIIRPRLDVLRVYYNQALPYDKGEFTLVNWYDANSLGLFKIPLFPSSKDVYSNFGGRVLSIPIIHVTAMIQLVLASKILFVGFCSTNGDKANYKKHFYVPKCNPPFESNHYHEIVSFSPLRGISSSTTITLTITRMMATTTTVIRMMTMIACFVLQVVETTIC